MRNVNTVSTIELVFRDHFAFTVWLFVTRGAVNDIQVKVLNASIYAQIKAEVQYDRRLYEFLPNMVYFCICFFPNEAAVTSTLSAYGMNTPCL